MTRRIGALFMCALHAGCADSQAAMDAIRLDAALVESPYGPVLHLDHSPNQVAEDRPDGTVLEEGVLLSRGSRALQLRRGEAYRGSRRASSRCGGAILLGQQTGRGGPCDSRYHRADRAQLAPWTMDFIKMPNRDLVGE